ncbi:MAG: carboxypeptidase-like regulatory domain-containing protein [Candidatus Cyclobacteriaceae bacterium M3_2C_046]
MAWKRILIALMIIFYSYAPDRLWAQTYRLDQPIDLSQTEGALRFFLEELEDKYGLQFSYSKQVVPMEKEVSLSQISLTLDQVLKELLQDTGIHYLLHQGVIILARAPAKDTRTCTVYGYVRDSTSRENLIGATVIDQVSHQGTITNNYGFFSLKLPAGEVQLTTSFVGYKGRKINFWLDQDTTIQLLPSIPFLKEVEIYSEKVQEEWSASQTGAFALPIDQLKRMPVFLGENDFTRTLQLLPGVHGGNEISSGLYIRGGGPDQNLVLMDGVPVYNAFHLLGLYSIFNDKAVNSVKLIKSGFPARYSGRLSSVLDINIKEGNQQKLSGEAALGFLTSKIMLEGPIIKGRTSFIISARRSYLDLYIYLLTLGHSNDQLGYFFYDFNFKVNHQFSSRDRVYFSNYLGKDKAFFNSNNLDSAEQVLGDFAVRWGNRISSLRWNHLFSENLFSNLTLSYSRYNFETGGNLLLTDLEQDQPESNNQHVQYNSGIRDITTRLDFDYYLHPNHLIRVGGSGIYHNFRTGILTAEGALENESTGEPPIKALETALYLENELEIEEWLSLNLGLNWSAFKVNQSLYTSWQPRLSAGFGISQKWTAKFSYARMAQFMHLLTNIGIGLPTDLWVPVTDRVRPQMADQVALSLQYQFNPAWEMSLEAFYKKMYDLIEFKDGAAYLDLEQDWQDLVVTGGGKSRGLELLIQRNLGRLTGWLGYSWSVTDRTFPSLNEGKTFPYTFDRRHDIGLALNYQKSEKFDVSTAWTYGTGNAYSLPYQSYFTPAGTSIREELFISGERNQLRLRSYHRLDLGFNWHKQKKHWLRTWTLGFYNVYNRRNPFFIFSRVDQGQRQFREFSLFPIIPSVAYKIKF